MKHAAKLPSRGAPSSSATAARRLSHAIAKAPPRKIRIVHVLAPEVIQTEARHFRELVQRLTGKPAPNGAGAVASPEDASASSPQGSCDTAGDEGPRAGAAVAAIKSELKEEAEMSSGGGGFLRSLGVEDGDNEVFFQGLEDFLFSSCNMDMALV
ncbi:VQ motif-containing protein 18-like [Phragmites australis]|uniref:VQ motif-containing protein 18-like n=1 Tax=Phragmites australis TaxID=29695 RepID=UPI002D78AB6D|nr:VQ motif-containing protein 18-like [Phragmites australis]